MVLIYKFKTHLQKRFFHFFSRFVRANMTHPKKVINEKVTEKLSFFFTFLYTTVCESFFGRLFRTFFNGYELSIKCCVLWYPDGSFKKIFFLLILAFIANFKARIGGNGSKNEKHIFKMCPRIPFYIYLRSGTWKLHFF